MKDIYQTVLDGAIALHKESKFSEAEVEYNRLLNRLPFEESLLFLLGDLYLRKNFNGLAINLFSALLLNNRMHGPAWCNLGAAFRKENEYEKAKRCWERSIEVAGENPEVCNNMATLYADKSAPQQALEWIEKVLKMEPDNVSAHWGKALALLTLREWDAGWKEYEWRQKLSNWDDRKAVIAPQWDGSHVGHLYVHGEQGVGDEVMFASALPMVKAGHVTVEVNAKVAPLIQKSFPDFDVVTEASPGDYDAKVPIASLIRMFGFNREPYLNPDPWRVEFYREELKKIGQGPYVALTWMGGTNVTRIEDRSILLSDLRPIMDGFTCVSAQHWADNPLIRKEQDEAMAREGLKAINDESRGLDLHEQAALFRAVDYVVTVQQTAVHVAGAVGAKTHCIIGTHPHWRYGMDGDSLPWYESVKLHRRTGDWKEVVGRVLADLRSV